MPLPVMETSEITGEENVNLTPHRDAGKVTTDHDVRHYIQPVYLCLEL